MSRGLNLDWPSWWEWELELSPRVEKRMEDRSFTELDLRPMMEGASGYRADVVDGRWAVQTRHAGRDWEVIVEPDDADQLLVVVTAYRIGGQTP